MVNAGGSYNAVSVCVTCRTSVSNFVSLPWITCDILYTRIQPCFVKFYTKE